MRQPSRRRPISRILSDRHVLLASALIAPVIAVQVFVSLDDPLVVAALCGGFVTAQIALGSLRGRLPATLLHLVRLLTATAFVTAASRLGPGDSGTPTFLALSIPVVAFGAMLGVREALFVAAASSVGYGIAVATAATISTQLAERGLVMAVIALVLAVGTRRTIASLEQSLATTRRAMAANRRRDRQLAAIEAVGALLAHAGPTDQALGGVIDLLVGPLNYRFASVYLGDRRRMRLGAQRGYVAPLAEYDADTGVVGRVMRTGQAQLVADVAFDPDYVGPQGDAGSLLSVPLLIGDEVVGVFNVKSPSSRILDERDVATLRLVADRLAASLALARERERLARRVEVFERLTAFSQALGQTLEPQELYERIPALVASVVASDVVMLAIRDASTGDYRLVALPGGDERFLGRSVTVGDGVVGRAIAERRLVVEERHARAHWASGFAAATMPDELAVAAAPLVREEQVIGAITVIRGVDDPFDELALEVLPLIGSHAALAIANAQLHQAAADASIRDPLTGLYNRRHLDASLERLSAARARLAAADRRPLSVVLFDLDRFGQVNKRYGHAVGDDVLRTFAGTLRGRTRASDLLARYGGEEFVVALDGATRDEAVRFAEEVRTTFSAAAIEGPNGVQLRATVSAGCAGLDPAAATLDGLLETADVGLAMAKNAGRDRVVAA